MGLLGSLLQLGSNAAADLLGAYMEQHADDLLAALFPDGVPTP